MSCRTCATQCREDDTPAHCDYGACHVCPACWACDKDGETPDGRCPILLEELDGFTAAALDLHRALTGPLSEMVDARTIIEQHGATWELIELAAWIERERRIVSPEPDPARELTDMLAAVLGMKRR